MSRLVGSFPIDSTLRGLFPLLALGALLSVAAIPAAAQGPAPGDVIRVTTGGPERVYRFRGVHGDTLVLADPEGVLLDLPVASVRRLEVGTPRARWKTMLRRGGLGGLMGAGLGFLLGSLVVEKEYFIMDDTYGEEGFVYGGLAGFAIGLVHGVFADTYRWRQVPAHRLEPRPDSSTGPFPHPDHR